MDDSTWDIARRILVIQINKSPKTRADLEAVGGPVWDTDELCRDYTVSSFAAPFVLVTRKADKQYGALIFQHNPRFYFDFVPLPLPEGENV